MIIIGFWTISLRVGLGEKNLNHAMCTGFVFRARLVFTSVRLNTQQKN